MWITALGLLAITAGVTLLTLYLRWLDHLEETRYRRALKSILSGRLPTCRTPRSRPLERLMAITITSNHEDPDHLKDVAKDIARKQGQTVHHKSGSGPMKTEKPPK